MNQRTLAPQRAQALGGTYSVLWLSALISSCVTLNKSLTFSEPQFPHLQNGHKNSTRFLVSCG